MKENNACIEHVRNGGEKRSLASNHLSKRGKVGKNQDLEPFQRLAMNLFSSEIIH